MTAILVWKCIRRVARAYNTGTLPAGGKCTWSSSFVDCISWMHLPAQSTDLWASEVQVPTVWNSLPSAVHDNSPLLNVFGWQLNNYLFVIAEHRLVSSTNVMTDLDCMCCLLA